jgi:hypothetical protein
VAPSPDYRGGGRPCRRRLGPRVVLNRGGDGRGGAGDVLCDGLRAVFTLFRDGRRLVELRHRLPDGA